MTVPTTSLAVLPHTIVICTLECISAFVWGKKKKTPNLTTSPRATSCSSSSLFLSLHAQSRTNHQGGILLVMCACYRIPLVRETWGLSRCSREACVPGRSRVHLVTPDALLTHNNTHQETKCKSSMLKPMKYFKTE